MSADAGLSLLFAQKISVSNLKTLKNPSFEARLEEAVMSSRFLFSLA